MPVAPKNTLQKTFQQTTNEARRPQEEMPRISYGRINKVNIDKGQVKVTMFRDGKNDINIGYHPIIQDTMDIFQRFGQITEGMCVKIIWRGRDIPKQGSTFIEIIGKGPGCNADRILKREPEANEISTSSFQILQGGLTSI